MDAHSYLVMLWQSGIFNFNYSEACDRSGGAAAVRKPDWTMNHLICLASLVGILSTAVVFGTDMFFLTVGRPALRLASASAVTEVMGFVHLFADISSQTGACPSRASWPFCPILC